MLYPRLARINGEETLVQDIQCVGYKEHMADRHRILFLSGLITAEMDNHNLIMTLDTLCHDPIKLVITSPGGDLDATFLLYDTLKIVQSPIITVGRFCASAAAIILAAGCKRYLYKHSRVMLHLPAGQMGGDARDWDIQHRQMERYRNRVVDILRECGAQKSEGEILADIDRDFWMEPTEAIAYGLADGIFTPGVWQDWVKEK